MRVIRLSFVLLLSMTLLPNSGLSQDAQLKVVTTEYPPYSYTDETGSVSGISTAIVSALPTKLNVDVPIHSYPWSMAYRTALEKKNTLIYSMVRTPEREELFEWVGVIVQGASFLYSLKGREDIRLHHLSDAEPYTIGVVRNAFRSK